MMPRLGEKYQVKIEVTSKPNAGYLNDEYFALDLPVAPAVMVGDEIVVEGSDVDQFIVEKEICRQLNLPTPVQEKKGLLKKLFGPK
jgi:hypothetical protein